MERLSEKIYKTPRNGQEMLKACPPGTRMFMYSDLARDPRPADKIISSLPNNSLILLQDPREMNSGHWICLTKNPAKREMYFFSSYGGKPDYEKNDWTPVNELIRSGQKRNVLNDGLKVFAQNGWTIHFNDKKYQVEGDDSATCGIWTAAFMNSKLTPDEFAKKHHSYMDYYYTYF